MNIKRDDRTPALPMPYVNTGRGQRLSRRELTQYWQRREQHLELHPDYDEWFRRPSPATADAVWSLLALEPPDGLGLKIEAFWPRATGFQPKNLPGAKVYDLTVTIEQALVVALDAAISTGRSVKRDRRRTDRWKPRPFTLTGLFDALALRWSDHFREGVETTPARRARDMQIPRVKAARRDLLLNGVALKPLWKLVTSNTVEPLYSIKPIHLKKGRSRQAGYQVTVDESSKLLVELEALLRADPDYRRPAIARPRLLLADDPPPARRDRHEVAGERAYDVVTLGERSLKAIEVQERTRLFLNVQSFLADDADLQQRAEELKARVAAYGVDVNASTNRPLAKKGDVVPPVVERPRDPELPPPDAPRTRFPQRWLAWQASLPPAEPPKLPQKVEKASEEKNKKKLRLPSERQQQIDAAPEHARRQIRSDIKAYHKLAVQRRAIAGVAEQVREIVRAGEGRGQEVTVISIKSVFSRVINRRFQWENFWPGDASGKLNQRSVSEYGTRYESSPRARWFSVEFRYGEDDADFETENLGGYDVSSSQTQILAVLLGLDKLERIARAGSFKTYMARRAWRLAQAGWLTLPHQRFRRSVPGYAGPGDSRLAKFVKELWMRVLYGSRVGQVVHDADPREFGPRWTTTQAEALLQAVPQYREVKLFLEACRKLAERAHNDDPFAGVVFVDPYDGARVRWNPVHRVNRRVESDQQALIINAPPRPACKPGEYTGEYVGDYRVNLAKLKQRVAPCLVHMLDSAYSGFVLEWLARIGVRTVVALHDCWYVPAGVDFDPAMIVEARAKAEADNHAAALAGSSWRVRPPGERRPSNEERVLQIAMDSAGMDWLRSLELVYDRLVDYLGDDEEFGGHVYRWRDQWRDRVAAQRWPKFKAAPSELSRWHPSDRTRGGQVDRVSEVVAP